MKKKNTKAFEIALSAISAAIATLFLSLGTLNNYLLALGTIVATLALTIPLSKSFWLGDLLAYIAASLLTLLFGGVAFIWRMLPFLTFFGLHPLANFLQFRLRIPKIPAFLFKALWFDGMLYLTWRFVFDMTTNFAFVDTYILPIIFIGGTLVFFVYDKMMIACQMSTNKIINKIRKD